MTNRPEVCRMLQTQHAAVVISMINMFWHLILSEDRRSSQ